MLGDQSHSLYSYNTRKYLPGSSKIHRLCQCHQASWRRLSLPQPDTHKQSQAANADYVSTRAKARATERLVNRTDCLEPSHVSVGPLDLPSYRQAPLQLGSLVCYDARDGVQGHKAPVTPTCRRICTVDWPSWRRCG
ncbi:unnamed protein product [Periconia digitata]|uniref:Uncharacterized protein n=1 Tax=Periconia digitata TaxID=1303443 RepID=A0A9W4UF15_9PLEO|nr:unnamed protein product [Periconia digitata]